MNDALHTINSTLGPREAATANGKLSSHRDRLWDELRDFDPADAECTTEEAVRALLGEPPRLQRDGRRLSNLTGKSEMSGFSTMLQFLQSV